MHVRSGYPQFHRTLEISAIGLFAAFIGGLVWRVVQALDGAVSWIILSAAILTGYVAADFVSGLVHWMADRFGSETTPLLGTNFIRPFREHHLYPEAITKHGFIETNGSNCILCAPVMGAAFFILPTTPPLISTFALGTTLAFGLAIFATNQFHKWAHMAETPRAAEILRKWSLILPAEHHDLHHATPFDRNYCITVGWWNPILQRVRFFEHMEAGVKMIRLFCANQDVFHETAAVGQNQNVIDDLP
jgi:ubiquitin-conjugating enzyme E2 variant